MTCSKAFASVTSPVYHCYNQHWKNIFGCILQMPGNAQKGNYILKLEGSEYGSTSGNIFYNETSLEFDTKQASLFIQLSKPIYRQSQTGKSFYF